MAVKLPIFYILLYNLDLNTLLCNTRVSHAGLACNGCLVAFM